ncbi:MAG: cysteine desulfurase [Deltaproteobacteria bacterium]|nr:cysteine desulfurase [Deltaproteobacteria bacterium]
MTPRAQVYLDYNASAPVRPEVRAAMEPLLFGELSFGNASSIHWAGREARRHLDEARRRIAERVGRHPSEVIFTSGGSEADNLALRGVMERAGPGARLILSAIEHPAVLVTAERLASRGVAVERIGVDREGRLDLEALDRALERPATLVSVMAVNNETGVIQPIDAVIERASRAGARVHVDAVQAAGRIPIPSAADLVTLSGHKIGGPKGVGVLLTRKALALEPQISGGRQERGHRAGTEPIALAVGMAVALERALADQDAEAIRLGAMRDHLEAGVRAIGGARILGEGAPRVAQTSTALFSGVEADALLQALDLAGVAASSGSACSIGSLEPSHVLLAMGVPRAEALGAIRFSLGWRSQEEDASYLLSVLATALCQARGAAPR